ncbi:uncharacterized protein LOC130891893 [Diorhabda carinulata]|uniref:uncharacterized protein LOC130891893 n=1 Tax=Diorhabda carinulata TaxID=1163345 RepID=UPI0025A0A029|nr:uncharacterized protein LOC130891893 [Diorhabda carinulata]
MDLLGYQKSFEDCVNQLSELFGNTLDLDVIRKVAVACNYNVMESSNKLIEMTTNQGGLLDGSKCKSYSSVALASGSTFTPLVNSSSCTTFPSDKSKKLLDFERCVGTINKGYKVMIILRGLPGSGKTTLAKKILENTVGYDSNYHLHILSADDYFCQNPRGIYEYNVRKIEDAHNWNQNRAFQATRRGFSPVIIDNTNTQMWELKAYASMAIDFGYILEILEPDTHWCFNDKELAKRNTHGVPRSKIKDYLDRYEKNITAKKLLTAYNLYYSLQKPPQMRLYPPLNVTVTNKVEKSPEPIDTINLMNFDDIEEDKHEEIHNKCNGINKNDIFLISDDDDDKEEEKVIENKDDLYSRWGVNETSLKSWDIVTPLQDVFISNAALLQIPKSKENSPKEISEIGIGTEDEYFRLIRNDNVLPGVYGNVRIIETINRDINYFNNDDNKPPMVSLKITLDKSCMTDDIYEDCALHLAELENLFPSVPKNHLRYWYNKCKGDLEWTIEFLLEAKDEVSSLIREEDEIADDDNDKDVEMAESSSAKSESVVRKRSRKICNSDTSQEEKIEIKKMLESKFDIGGEHYSQHLRRIKQYTLKNNKSNETRQPSTSGVNNLENVSPESDICVIKVDDVITIDSDSEFDDIDTPSETSTPEETIELNLGETFVSQLESRFADPNIKYPKGLLPVVQMPVTLAKQLYTFYIESVYQQMENQQNILETLVKEDEEFARKLQAKEQEELDAYKPPPVPNLKEIMDDQKRAQKIYQTEIEKWKNFDPDTLADKLTKQKLIKSFPTVPTDVLLEVLHAHDNKYVDTVETLIASTGPANVKGSTDIVKEPPIEDDVLNEMKEEQKKHSNETLNDEQLQAEAYREEANKYLKKRTDLYQKAQKYYQKGMTEVAQFYSGLASLQTIYYDRANSMAAAAFLDEHSKRLQDFNTLDLHFLYVKEAIPALDMFLDRNINLLRTSTSNKKTEYLQIITGRGKRSDNGMPKIKPAVITRLTKRKVKFVQLNPGLLKVKIEKSSLVTSELA